MAIFLPGNYRVFPTRLHVWGGLRLVFGRNAGGRSVDGTKSWGPRSAVTVQGIRAAGQARLHQRCRWPVVAWEGLLYGVPMRASVTEEEMEGYRLRAVVWPAQCAGRAVSAPHFPSVLNFHCGRYVL